MKDNSDLKTIFKKYLKELIKNEFVLGVAITGSYGRNDSDQYSDIDYVVFIDNKSYEAKITEGKFFYDKILFDSRIVDLESLKKEDWSCDMYFSYLNGNIIYDKSRIVKKILGEKMSQWEKNIAREISMTLVNLSVIFRFSDNWRGLNADSHYFKFIKRKDYTSAHRVLNLGFELILDLLYLINKKPIPDAKNKTRLLNNLNWIPKEINASLAKSLLVIKKTKSDCERRYNSMNKCLEIIKEYVDKNIILDDNLYEYYLKNR